MIRIVQSSLLALVVGALVLTSCTEEVKPTEKKERALPIVGERDVEYRMVDGVEVADTIYHHVPLFEYLNHDSIMISSEDFKDKIWVADFFFTHCPTICPPMTSQMHRLSRMTSDLDQYVQFLSFSIDPKKDTPSRLKEYMKAHEIQATNWSFMTGDEAATHRLAKEFFNGAERNDDIEGGFGHTPYFALVDIEGLVRGVYIGTDVDAVDQLEKDMRKLLRQEYGITGSK
ncbi:MAG: SCO family protein [Crocinitomicaceae bacterium]|nr:SCO family protein [Crocinitomicaceae bacterium]